MNLYRLYKNSNDKYIIVYKNEAMVEQKDGVVSFCGQVINKTIAWQKCESDIARNNKLVFVSQSLEKTASYPYDKLNKALEYIAQFNLQDKINTIREAQFEYLARKTKALANGSNFTEEFDLSSYYYSDALRDVKAIAKGAL